MTFSELIQKWSGIRESDQIFIVVDDAQLPIAQRLKEEGIFSVRIAEYSPSVADEFHPLKETDLLIVLLSFDTFMAGAYQFFSPFQKPSNLTAKYIFVRLGVSLESLLEGLSTDKARVYGKIAEMNRLPDGASVRVTNAAGTDISFQIHPFSTCQHEITEPGGMAFLPPSETSSDVITDTACGRIVVDVTIGQLYRFKEQLEYFGRTDEPVTLIVRDGYIADVQGGKMADDVRRALFSLTREARRLVELGQGLSDMTPTGLIGVNESILSSCHFGFGDGGSCGTHWDVVISSPVITQF